MVQNFRLFKQQWLLNFSRLTFVKKNADSRKSLPHSFIINTEGHHFDQTNGKITSTCSVALVVQSQVENISWIIHGVTFKLSSKIIVRFSHKILRVRRDDGTCNYLYIYLNKEQILFMTSWIKWRQQTSQPKPLQWKDDDDEQKMAKSIFLLYWMNTLDASSSFKIPHSTFNYNERKL